MRSVTYLPQLLTVFIVSAAAAAQSPWGFPLDRQFRAISLNGQSYGASAPTLTIKRESNQDNLAGAGFAGCNRWTGQIKVTQNEFGVGPLGTTKMFCSDRMAEESSFLNALKSAKRWRMDGPTLVLEGDQTKLTLTPIISRNP